VNPPRIAFFPDSYYEVNGVANTSRRFVAHARERGYPMLAVVAGPATRCTIDGSVTLLELERGMLSFALDKDLRFDLALLRHHSRILEEMRAFRADIVHITGPSDLGIAGMTAAHELQLPLAASWHTNVHEYAGKRISSLAPRAIGSQAIAARVEGLSFHLTARYYAVARLLFAPNQELMDQLERASGRPCRLMSRGVDAEQFHPDKRQRDETTTLRIGYVGRLTTEKNIRDMIEVARALQCAGVTDFRIAFIGQGAEYEWLEQNVPHAEMMGVRRGEELARAYADLDIFVFPSTTDTFGNVVLEALASGVPAVVRSGGGPKFIVRDGESGLVAETREELCKDVVRLAKDAELRRKMSIAARALAIQSSWSSVFDAVYNAYAEIFPPTAIEEANSVEAAR